MRQTATAAAPVSPAVRPSKAKIRKVLRDIRLRHNGACQAPVVVEESRPDDHPLHVIFEWDDTVCGEHYRIEQARRLIHSVNINIKVGERIVKLPEYVPDPQKKSDGGGYVSVQDVLRQPTRLMARQIVADAFTTAAGFVNRARQYAHLFGLADETARVERRLLDLRGRAQSAPVTKSKKTKAVTKSLKTSVRKGGRRRKTA